MARRATRFGLLAALGIAILVATLAGQRMLRSRAESQARIQLPLETPPVGVPSDGPAGTAPPDQARSDRERILAWAARHKGSVSFDPIEWFLEDTTDERTWHDDPRDMPAGEIVAVWLPTEDLDAALAELPDGVVIPVLDLPNDTLTPASAACLLRIRGLRVLEVGQDTTDDVVAVLAGLSELEWLHIDGERVTDASLVHIGCLTKLRHLGLIGIGIRGETGASALLPAGLEALHVHTRRGLDDRFVTALPHLPRLRDLYLRETWITDGALPKIGTFRALRELDLGNMRLTDAGIEHLRDLQQLEQLDLSGSPITDGGLATIAKLASLENLWLGGTRVEALPGIDGLARLRSLDLRSSNVTDEAFGRLAPLKELAGLNLANTKITDASLAAVGALTGLRSLCLGETKVTSRGLAHLQGLGALEDLELWRTPVDDAGMRCLAGLRSLRTLDVWETGVTAEGLLALKELPHLQLVDIGWIGPADRERLKAAMPSCEFQ